MGATDPNVGKLVFGLFALAVVLLAANAWGLRSRLPIIGSPHKLQAATGWAVLLLAAFAGIVATTPTTTRPASTESVPPTGTPRPVDTARPVIAVAQPTATTAPATARPGVPIATPVPVPLTPQPIAAPPSRPEAPSAPELPVAYPPRPALGLSSARVTRVIDGDTVEVTVGVQRTSLRAIGIDTPELDPRTLVQCFGREASARTKELLEGQTVSLEADSSQSDRDQYGRTLRYVWLADGRLFNLEMIREGFAHEYTFEVPYKYQEAFKRAQAEAREQNRGLWSPDTCGGDTAKPADQAAPPLPQGTAGGRTRPVGRDCPATHSIKGNQGSRSTTEWIYHVPGGGSYAVTVPEECFAAERDALAAGYRRARN